MSNIYPEGDPQSIDNLQKLIAANEAYRDVLKSVIGQVQEGISECELKMKMLMDQQSQTLQKDSKKKKPVTLYMPPYFKDENGMYPPLNEEARQKMNLDMYNPLMKEEKRWTTAEISLLQASVKKCLINEQVDPLIVHRDSLTAKLKKIDTNTTREEKMRWKDELETICRNIDYYRNQSDSQVLTASTDYSRIEWNAMSNVEFKKTRSAEALKAKWMNEQSPKWNKGPWTKEELQRVKELRETPSFVSWNLLSIALGTNRTAYQCFQKYKREVTSSSTEWTEDEDRKLIALVKMFTNNSIVQWDKVAQFMTGRSRQQLRTRYTHTLDTGIKHGRWTDNEDLLLMCSVNKHGAKDWGMVAEAVPGRCDAQCRERWCNILSKKITKEENFTLEEDELLTYAVQLYGRGNWAKCKSLLPKKNPRQIRRRYIQLVNAKLKLVSGFCSAAEAVEFGRSGNHDSLTEKSENARLVRIFDKFTQVNDCVDNDYEALVRRINTDSGQNDPEKYSRFKEQVDWKEVEANVKKINLKHEQHDERGEGSLAEEVLNMVEITEQDIGYILQSNARTSIRSRTTKRKVATVDSFTNKRIRPLVTEDSSLDLITTFDPDVPEEERQMTLVESLCVLVRNRDYAEWVKKYKTTYYKHSQDLADFYVKKILDSNTMVDNNTLSFRLTMAPNITTCTLFKMLMKCRHHLNTLASTYFYPVDVENREEFGDAQRISLNKNARLHIKLSAEITGSEMYKTFSNVMRATLLEPAILESATEKIEKSLMKVKLREMIEKREKEEEEAAAVDVQKTAKEETSDMIKKILTEGIVLNDPLPDMVDAKKKRAEKIMEIIMSDVATSEKK